MKTYYDPDVGQLHAAIDDSGCVEIHRRSAVSGSSMIPLGIAARQLALDVLMLSGQADAATVQIVAGMIEARAEADDALSIAEMRAVAATLRHGITLPALQVLATCDVLQFRPARAVVRSVPVGAGWHE